MATRRSFFTAAVLAAVTAVAVMTGCAPLAVQTAEPVVAEGDGPIVAFYGDSYTLGTGASDVSLRWSTQISQQHGWREFNPSVNGLGFVNNRQSFDGNDLPGQIIAQDPEIVFVTMGLNDNFTYDFAGAQIEEQIDADLERLTTELPEARIIMVEPFWYTSARPASLETIISWVREAAERYELEHISGASEWIAGKPGLMAEDGLHPNDAGYALMTDLMNDELAELGL